MAKKAKKKKKKIKLSPAELEFKKLQNDHKKAIRSVFTNAGFLRVSALADKEFVFDGQMGDLDDYFIFENIVVAVEYTSKSSGIGEHLKPKKILFDKILSNHTAFIEFLGTKFPHSKELQNSGYHESQLIFKLLYCSRFHVEEKYKTNVPGPIYFDYPAVRYFSAVSAVVKKSVRHELFQFMEIPYAAIGEKGKIETATTSKSYKGLILPEANSHFQKGFKVVSFFVDPEKLLRSSYVLRKNGWRESSNLYQRMISDKKIKLIRQYLKKQKRVFINNIIVTLPHQVQPLSPAGTTIDVSTLNSTEPIEIKLPDTPNSIGLIDGQHRVFAYHETEDDDQQIAQLRKQQNLLVTGIIYPEKYSVEEREKFEARLFLEINSTQATAKSDLKQAIGMVLDPFSADSIASRVLTKLARKGPLAGHIEQYFFEKDKLKTSSIVSYGMKPLVKLSGEDSLYSIWQHPSKLSIAKGEDADALNEYTDYCAEKINLLLVAIRKNVEQDRWTTNPKVGNRVLSTTYINSFLIVLRLLIDSKLSVSAQNLEAKLKEIGKFKFGSFHSSQYKRMAEHIVFTYFGIPPKG